MVASGGHSEALERICDALANQLDAERVVAAGAGHFVAAAPGFIRVLERFLRCSEPGTSASRANHRPASQCLRSHHTGRELGEGAFVNNWNR
jgi:hypothetical protein